MAVAKKPVAKKAASKPKVEESKPQKVTEAAGPEMVGEEYQQGYVGVSGDDEDYSLAAEVARLADGE